MRAHIICIVLAFALSAALSAAPAAAAPPGEEAFTFTANGGQSVEAFRGRFAVPENRADPDSREISIRYVRFPATGERAGAPIVYLAGGPGGSGIATAAGRRFPLFMAMREFGDVIALDQRGTGQSDAPPPCRSGQTLDAARAWTDTELADAYRRAAEECGAFWRAEGVDLAGYTTVESARDLDALRAHLGAEAISLWGISYGTHLALAALKVMDGRIDRMVLASAEGLDQTVKLPARTDAYFARLQGAIDTDPAGRAALPDIAALMRRVHSRFDADPVLLDVPTGEAGETAPVLLTGRKLQMITSGLIADPYNAMRAMRLYQALEAGEVELAKGLLARFMPPDEPIAFGAMPLAMDVASGISGERLAAVEAQARTSLLGPYLNFPMPHLRGALGLDLGDDFRAAPVSEVPTLLLTGMLDGRTYPDEQRAAVAGLSDVTLVTVVNAGHNLFMTTPEVTAAIQRFMRGEDVGPRGIVAPLPPLPGPAE